MRTLLKRWWFWAGPAFIFVALVAGYLLIPVKQSQISQTTCDKIQLGMSEEQVQEILGRRRTTIVTGGIVDRDAKTVRKSRMEMGLGDEDGNTIYLEFGTTSRVTEKRFVPTELSFLEIMNRRIERRIGALWR